MDLGPWEIAIIAVVILVLFGSAKLPQAARSLGRSMRIFKSETKGLIGDDDDKQNNAPTDARAEAARLRAEAARLEAQAGPQQLNPPVNDGGANGVPLRQTEHDKQS
ncbi:Sec-independent protein translocase subunit TatA [Actinomadura sp. DC4]|uniref:Sec-independent protein translocase subunit TatA n=1 Tax=Actinomadura sp. DC4 TaxID=3055069 RepID=UPI0025B08375|nr:Sec-independent protein translocase subunit TatA [Actinomadura sp. DC4]MDN3355206.1 Sec-independent protein translocase subunit TatA [Actinomadura sp. DC4]